MSTVRILMFGDEMFIRRMRRLEARVLNPVNALERIADDMMRVIGATFRSQGRRYGGSWKALSKSQIRRKAALNQDPRILIASGALMKSYTRRNDPSQKLRITPIGITLDSDLSYGEIHQKGLGDAPKREFIKFYPPDKARWTKMIERDLMAAYRGGRYT